MRGGGGGRSAALSRGKSAIFLVLRRTRSTGFSTSTADVWLTSSENASAAELSKFSSVSGPHTPPLSSVQVHPKYQAVSKATNQKGQQVYRGDDGERWRPVTIVAVEERRGRG